MNKMELVCAMADKADMTKKEAENALNSFMSCVEDALKNKEKVQLVGFGVFEAKERAARQGRNPRNPEQVIEIPATVAPTFKAGKAFKEMLNEK